ncbi:ribose-phosphate diphosphokinase [Nanoarchaeota archaeon]
MLVIGCPGSENLARKIANKAKASYSTLSVKKFPDGELHIRFLKDVKNKKIVLVQSFHGNINERIIQTLFAAYTAKDLKVKKVILAAPYFAYLREDKRFKPGECISARITSKLFDVFDKVFIVDPHLHRIKKIKQLFKKGVRVTSVKDIASYIKKNIKNPVIVGPDKESFQWAEAVAKLIKAKATILEKKRYTARRVHVSKIHTDLKNKNLVIVDDIISTGGTMVEALKQAKKLGPKGVYCIAVHGVFVNNALQRLKKHGKVIATNTIPGNASRIDVSGTIAEAIKNV